MPIFARIHHRPLIGQPIRVADLPLAVDYWSQVQVGAFQTSPIAEADVWYDPSEGCLEGQALCSEPRVGWVRAKPGVNLSTNAWGQAHEVGHHLGFPDYAEPGSKWADTFPSAPAWYRGVMMFGSQATFPAGTLPYDIEMWRRYYMDWWAGWQGFLERLGWPAGYPDREYR